MSLLVVALYKMASDKVGASYFVAEGALPDGHTGIYVKLVSVS